MSRRKQRGNFEKSPVELASLPATEDLKFERADWTIFRTVGRAPAKGRRREAFVASAGIEGAVRQRARRDSEGSNMIENVMGTVRRVCRNVQRSHGVLARQANAAKRQPWQRPLLNVQQKAGHPPTMTNRYSKLIIARDDPQGTSDSKVIDMGQRRTALRA